MSVGNLNLDVNAFLSEHPRVGENAIAEGLWVGAGGAAANYAVMLASLGRSVSLVSLVSPLAVRAGLLQRLVEAGVDVSYVRVIEGEPNVALIITAKRELSRTVISYRGVSRQLRGDMVPSGDHLHFASVRPSLVLEAARRAPLSSYDPGGESFKDPRGVAEAVSEVSWVFLNERECKAVARDPSELLRGRSEMVIVKRGPRGALLVSADSRLEASAPSLGEPVDVTGTGDAFDAVFNAVFLKTRDPELSLRAASVAGALKSTRLGSSNMPSREELAKAFKDIYGEELEL
ncbi:MAG: PfkB family carbohydrate kinase [Acidilobaceae archaeon]|nr:PfkB family carbohydrate kinase [Acidilobaceae archaeon]